MSNLQHGAWRRSLALCIGVTVVVLVGACSASTPVNNSVPISQDQPGPALRTPYPVPTLTTPADTGAPGGVIRVEDPPRGVDPQLTELGAQVKRIVYRSTSGLDGKPTVVSGIFVIPTSPAPRDGFPLIAFGHGNSGIRERCAPSLYANMLGNAKIIAALILNGYAVVMPDYQGLGQAGYVHPFLDGRTYGNNMIDGVRAVRTIAPGRLGDRWISYGVSLGGLASWAAADRAGEYGGGLDLLGTVAIVPVADMSQLVDRAVNGTLTRDQYALWLQVVESMAETYPAMNIENYRSAYAKSVWDVALECLPITNYPNVDDVQSALNSLRPVDVMPKSTAAAEFIRSRLAERALPFGRNPAPAMILYGTLDPLVAPEWTERAIAKSCAQGQRLDVIKRIGETHANLDSSQAVNYLATIRSNTWNYSNCEDRP